MKNNAWYYRRILGDPNPPPPRKIEKASSICKFSQEIPAIFLNDKKWEIVAIFSILPYTDDFLG